MDVREKIQPINIKVQQGNKSSVETIAKTTISIEIL